MAGSNDSAVRMWQVTGGQIRSTFMGHDNKIYSVKFYSHSQKIVSGSHDRTLRLWDVRTSKSKISFRILFQSLLINSYS